MKIFKNSFDHVFKNSIEWVRVAYGPIMVYIIGAFLSVLIYLLAGVDMAQGGGGMNSVGAFFGWLVGFVTSWAAMLALYINGYRYAVLKEGGDCWWTFQIDRRLGKLLLYYLLIGLLSGLYIGISFGILMGSYYIFESVWFNFLLGFGFLVFGLYLLFRVTLTFLLVAVDVQEPLRTGWDLLGGNVLRILGLSVLIGLTILVTGIIGGLIFAFVGWVFSFVWTFITAVVALLGVFFFLVLWFISWAATTKAFALVYMSLTKKKGKV